MRATTPPAPRSAPPVLRVRARRRTAPRPRPAAPSRLNHTPARLAAPVVKISTKLNPTQCEVYAKCEYFNPLSSVKDRLAIAIIEDAEKSGALKPGDTVVEATSGNTGIAVAMVCAQRGYDCVIVMAEPFSVERRRLMRMLGAKVIVTPKGGKVLIISSSFSLIIFLPRLMLGAKVIATPKAGKVLIVIIISFSVIGGG